MLWKVRTRDVNKDLTPKDQAVAETWRRVWGGRKNVSRTKILNDVFSEKIPIFTPNNSDDLFLVIDQVFLIFPFFFKILCIFTVLNVEYDPFFTRKTTISENNSLTTPFFTLFVLSRASDNTTSQNIGGDGCMGHPPPQILGGQSP